MLEATAIGRLVAEPQLREIKKNDHVYNVCEFGLACQQRKDKVDFVKAAAWRGMGDFIFKHVQKGQKVFVSGELTIPPFDKEKGRAFEPYITVKDFEFCDSKKKELKEEPPAEAPIPDDESLYNSYSENDIAGNIPE